VHGADRLKTPPAHSADRLSNVLQILAGLETDGPSGRDAHFFARARIATDTALSRLYLEHTKPAQLDPITTLHRETHRIEDGVYGHLSFDFGDVGDL
jgi:hypothetical protein